MTSLRSGAPAIQPFFQPNEHFFLIFRGDPPALMRSVMLTELAVSISVPAQRHGPCISRPYVDMKMGIGRRALIEAVHQAAPIAQSRAQDGL